MSEAPDLNVVSVAPAPTVTEWINGRVYCPTCNRVAWVIAHPEAIIACRYCEGPTRKACGDEYKTVLYDRPGTAVTDTVVTVTASAALMMNDNDARQSVSATRSVDRDDA